MTNTPPRLSGAARVPAAHASSGVAGTTGRDDRAAWSDWAVPAGAPQAGQTHQQPQHAYPAQQYHALHREAATAQRVRDRDAARRRVGGVTAALAVAALVGTGAAVIASQNSGTTTATSSTSSSGTSSSSSSSSNSGTVSNVSSSSQSGVASSSGS